MKKVLYISLALMMMGLASCQKNEIAENALAGKQVTITVAMPTSTPDTKTVLDETEMVAKWQTGDEISVLYESNPTANIKFTLNPEDNGKSIGRFTGTFPAGEGAPVDGENYYLCYPYQTNPVMSNDGGLKITIDYPAIQNGSSTFAQNVMVGLSREGVTTPAQMQDTPQDFDNISALLKVSIKGEGKLMNIYFNDLSEKPVNGRVNIEANVGGFNVVFPAAATESSQTFLTYKCNGSDGVALSSEAQTFFLTVPARNYEEGYRVVFELDNGKQMILTAGSAEGKELQISKYYTAPEVTFAETANKLFYQGVVYKTKQLLDGRVWMVDNMRYIPTGKTVSDDPATPNGIWYCSNVSTSPVAQTDPDSVAVKGLLYDAGTAFGGVTITKDNYSTFENVQGICPDGWHIPNKTEIVNLVGRGVGYLANNTEAPYYSTTTSKGSIALANNDGFNFYNYGYVNRTKVTATGAYCKIVYDGKINGSYLLGSSSVLNNTETIKDEDGNDIPNPQYGLPYYTPISSENDDILNVQYYGIMGFLNATNESINTINCNFLFGMHVRCIKNVD